MKLLGFAGVLALVVGLTACGGAWAGVKKVAATGDPAPGFTGYTFTQTFGNPWLNESGQVGFYGDVMSGALSGSGLFLYDSTGGRALVRGNDPAPGGGTFVLSGRDGSYALNDAGQMAFYASTMPSGPYGYYRTDGISLLPLIRQGDPAPGTGGGTVGSFGANMYSLPLNLLGQSTFNVSISGVPVLFGIYRANGLSLTPVAVGGQVAPGTGGAMFSNIDYPPVLTNDGNVVFTSRLAGAPVGRTSGLFIQDDGTLALLAQEGDVAPGTGGATFTSFVSWGPVFPSAVAGHDKVAAAVGLKSGSPNGPALGIFRWSAGVASPVVLQKQTVPEGNGVFDFLAQPVINDSGQVAFFSFVAATANPSQDNQGLYLATDGALTTIARTGNASADGNGQIHSLGGLALSNSGLVAFEAYLTMTAGGDADNRAIFITDGVETVKVARKGEALAGTSSTADLVTLGASGPPGVTTNIINAYGQVAFTASWSGSQPNSGIFLFTPELSWRSAAGGSWDNHANWSLGLTPAHVHPVTIDPATSLTVTGPAGDVTIDSLRVAAHGGGAAVLDLAAGGNLTVIKGIIVDAGGTLRLASGTLDCAQLTLNPGAHLVAELAGTTPGSQYDQVGVGGLASLDGTLDVVLLGGFTPACGDTFDIFDFGAFDGSFDAVNLPALGGGLSWDASGLYSTGQLGVVPEPATLTLVGLGLAASLLRGRKRG